MSNDTKKTSKAVMKHSVMPTDFAITVTFTERDVYEGCLGALGSKKVHIANFINWVKHKYKV
jgi:hypothetical protein